MACIICWNSEDIRRTRMVGKSRQKFLGLLLELALDHQGLFYTNRLRSVIPNGVLNTIANRTNHIRTIIRRWNIKNKISRIRLDNYSSAPMAFACITIPARSFLGEQRVAVCAATSHPSNIKTRNYNTDWHRSLS